MTPANVPATPAITYSLAVHNSATFMEAHLRRLIERLHEFPSAEIILVENGSSDGSLSLARRLAGQLRTERVTIRVDSVEQGLGNAHRRGLALARGDLVVVIGLDLPFGFSDLDQWQRLNAPPQLVFGSKSHRRSELQVSLSRRVLSFAFRTARWVILGIGAGDTQGSILIEGELARRIQPRLACTDYLVTTEICAWAARFGVRGLEIPITYADPRHSTVSPLHDGFRMLRGMFALRQRLHSAVLRSAVRES